MTLKAYRTVTFRLSSATESTPELVVNTYNRSQILPQNKIYCSLIYRFQQSTQIFMGRRKINTNHTVYVWCMTFLMPLMERCRTLKWVKQYESSQKKNNYPLRMWLIASVRLPLHSDQAATENNAGKSSQMLHKLFWEIIWRGWSDHDNVNKQDGGRQWDCASTRGKRRAIRMM